MRIIDDVFHSVREVVGFGIDAAVGVASACPAVVEVEVTIPRILEHSWRDKGVNSRHHGELVAIVEDRMLIARTKCDPAAPTEHREPRMRCIVVVRRGRCDDERRAEGGAKRETTPHMGSAYAQYEYLRNSNYCYNYHNGVEYSVIDI